MSQKDEFQTIDANALATVAGGTGTTTSGTSTDDQVLNALTGILNSLQSLNQNNNNNGSFGVPEMLMLFTIMKNQQQPTQVISPYGGGYPWGYPYYY
jgi:hypothetical protein